MMRWVGPVAHMATKKCLQNCAIKQEGDNCLEDTGVNSKVVLSWMLYNVVRGVVWLNNSCRCWCAC
jgi:hypothetical protein